VVFDYALYEFAVDIDSEIDIIQSISSISYHVISHDTVRAIVQSSQCMKRMQLQ